MVYQFLFYEKLTQNGKNKTWLKHHQMRNMEYR